ncbi:MAG TPA: YjbE family putative metal transport protein [Burkholderiaceae bacterium]|jgi:YjbE family integral membrane protein
MGIASAIHGLNLALGVFFLDLLLSGDNAIVIALACRGLPEATRRQAVLMGTGAAIGLRVVLTLVASLVLRVPLLKLLGGIALVVIAIKLTLADDDAGVGNHLPGDGLAGAELMSVFGTIVVADLVMSADNVIALAAVANGSLLILVLGLLLSVPLLMFGSWHLTTWLTRWPALTRVGGALLGWFAGSIAVADPLYADWVDQQSPGLHWVVPALGAVYVLLQARIIETTRAGASALRPRPRPRATPRPAPLAAPRRPIAASPVAAVTAELTPIAPPAAALAAPPRSGKVTRWQGLALGAGGIAALGVAILVVTTLRAAAPGDLARYDCPNQDISLYYRPGGAVIGIAHGSTRANGKVDADHQIDWGDYHDASVSLGFVPPTRLLFGDAQSVRIDGGMFEDVACRAH